MTGTSNLQRHRFGQLLLAALISLTLILPQAVVPAMAASQRAIYLYYTHTKETARIVFKRNGQYVQSGLNELNVFLRDWRRNEPAKMDPRLFDLVWEVYQEVGATQPINVVSAYRSPKTNAMLRETSSGVAENSQHTKGNAMDFFIPGVSLPRLRAAAMKKQVGGVGFYPTSGSPFVHLDTGSVRAWPRMTRAQLQEIFPDGKTMHLPTDGKPLSQQGYQVAMAEWKKCHSVPCNGSSSSGTQVAEAGSGRTLVDLLFGGAASAPASAPATASARAPSAPAAAPTPAAPTPAAPPASVQMAALDPQTTPNAPIPALRPTNLGGVALAGLAPASLPFATSGSAPLDAAEVTTVASAPLPLRKSEALQRATSGDLSSGDAVTAIAALTAPPVPQPRLITSAQPEMLTAYLSPAPQDRAAQSALEPIIQREATAAATPVMPVSRMAALPPLPGDVAPAAPGSDSVITGAISDLFRGTFTAPRQDEPVAQALVDHLARHPAADAMRRPELVAPDLEHVADVFITPTALSSDHFAQIWDHDEADFSPTTELGSLVPVLRVGDFPEGLSHTRFVGAQPVAQASN